MTTKEMVVRLCSGNLRQICGNAEWFRTNNKEYAKELIKDVFIIADLIDEVNDEREDSLGTKGCYLCT